MLIVFTGKLLFWFSFVFIYLSNNTIVAQPDFLSFHCIGSVNFIRNSTYERNLDANLLALPTTNSGFGFYNFSNGQGSDTTNSIALCRGDVNPDVCLSCLNDSIVKLRQVCPNRKEAIGYYDNCMLKYSNQTLLGISNLRYYVFLWNTQNASDKDGFNRNFSPLMDQLISKAARGDRLLKFASGKTTMLDFTTIYALVQCTPDLSQRQCSHCLEDAFNRFSSYGNNSGKFGGRALLPMCTFRYEIYPFYNVTTLVIPPPPSSSPPRPPDNNCIFF